MRLGVFCAGMFWCVTALASHSYGGLDLCKLYPEIMPPGMQPSTLPQPQSRGAGLLQTYCTQCHALPGPGRHTADEWQAVLDKMNLLMEVASRFGGLMGKVEVPDAGEKEIIRTYLTDNALQGMQGEPRGMGAAAFSTHCGSCHALPAAGQHSPEQWSAVLRRIQRNMTVMKYAAPPPEVMLQIQLYLQQHSKSDPDGIPAGGLLSPASTGDRAWNARELLDSGRWLALGPLLLLLLVGLTRWWQGRTRP